MKKLPEYNVLLPDWQGPETQFDDIGEALRPMLNGTITRVAPEDKKQPVHEGASTCDSLLAVHPHAIEIGAPMGTGEVIGNGNTFIAFSLGMMGIGIAAFWVAWGASNFWLPLLVGIVMFGMGFLFCSFALRMSHLAPRDIPVGFNRKTREVSICVLGRLRFWRFWERVGIDRVVTTSWDELQARSYKIIQLTGEAARDTHVLRLLWGERQNPRKLEGIALIGYLGWYEDAALWRLWEHIRRYMEEGGPAIQPGESLRTSGAGKLPELPAEVIAEAGGPALSAQEVARLAGVEA
ncbi:DUF6708 domain-containing protein [Variovorax sp. PAMC26660]|uniref:DUF6708 domain-containing protein n=1 Tax=Variovorax sp. PAMC26660 TaxID=2762322 RepID=UPI0021C4AB9D|nr:DUF6708 domain-containing protein [Variovorax sp. PAMC26660]